MTTEEKARAYDGAVKKAKEIKEKIVYSHLSTESCKAVSEYVDAIIPELRESEDERIRKELIEQVGYILPDKEEYDDEGRVLPTYHERIGRYRAWLEKQKESLHISETCKENTDSFTDEDEKIREFLIDYFTSYKIGNITTKLNGYKIDDILAYLEKQKEQKPVDKPFEEWIDGWYNEHHRDGYITMDEREFKNFCRGTKNMYQQKPTDEQFPPLEGLDAIKAKYYDEGFKNGFDEGIESVKPAEWSDEDEKILNELLDHCNTENATWYNFLKSLCPQSKIEWSEKDYIMMQDLIDLLWIIQGSSNIKPGTASKYEQWLKSLRPHWKPSEEQMKILNWAANGMVDKSIAAPEMRAVLRELYEQLKAL